MVWPSLNTLEREGTQGVPEGAQVGTQAIHFEFCCSLSQSVIFGKLSLSLLTFKMSMKALTLIARENQMG
jgi:hypothetical protein